MDVARGGEVRAWRSAVPDRGSRLVGAGFWLLFAGGLVLIFLPLVLTVYLSFFDEKLIIFPPHAYTLHWYREVIPHFASPLLTTFEVAAIGVPGSLLLGVPAGLALVRSNFRAKGAIATLLLAPLTVPLIAAGLAIYLFAVAIEELTGAPLAGSFSVLVAGHLLITTPWVVRLVVASLVGYDRSAEEAAASLGARPATVFRRVTLPAMRQGLIAALLFSFIATFGELEMTLFLISPGMTTLPIALLGYLKYHIDPLIAATTTLQMVLIGSILAFIDRFVIRLGQLVR